MSSSICSRRRGLALRCSIRMAAVSALLGVPAVSSAQIFQVSATSGTGAGSLYSAIQQADAFGGGSIINVQNGLGTINAGNLPSITASVTINGGTGNTISGQNANRIFFINAPGQTVQIQSLTLANGLARGGNGGNGGGAGGGGSGMGGAIFVNAGALNLQSVSFSNNAAVGGTGGTATYGGGGGGGGLSFAGGAGTGETTVGNNTFFESSGGGGGALSGVGGNANVYVAGNGGGFHGGVANSNATGPDGGGGGGTLDTSAFNPQGTVAPIGGSGGDFGGGGGGAGTFYNSAGVGGAGGFGAGGGGGADAPTGFAGDGGAGGFGGGGGGGGGTSNVSDYGPTQGGIGGFDAGDGGYGNEGGGGGGAALGGAIFVRSGNGTSLSLSDVGIDAGSLAAGVGGYSGLSGHGGNTGSTAGGALFLMGGNTNISVSAGSTQTISGSIAQSAASSLTLNGGGTLVLSGNNQSPQGYSGGTVINGGELSVASDTNLGATAGAVTLNGGSLQITGISFSSTTRMLNLGTLGGGIDIVSPSNLFTINQVLSGSGGLNKLGAGTLALTNANTYTGKTNVSGGILQLGYPINGTAATLPAGDVVTVFGGGTLMLGSAGGQANVIGGGLNAPNVSIPNINLAGGILTTYPNTTHNVGYLYLNGGAITGDPATPSIFYDFTFNSPVTVDASIKSSTITAPGGIGLRVAVPFNVSSGAGELLVTGSLHDEPNNSGGVTKNLTGLLVLDGNDTYSAGTIVNAGTLLFAAANAFPANTALAINAGNAQFANLTTGAKFLTQISSLTIGGSSHAWAGKVDITNTDLIIHGGSLATLSDQANAGLNGSSGITSSTAVANPSHLTAVGIIQNNQSGSALFGASHLFDGVAPAAGDFLAKYTYFGDANLDGKVDGSDYSRIDSGYLNHATGWYNGDFNYDGVVNGSDYTLIDNVFNRQGAQIAAAVATPTASIVTSVVPEPSILGLVGIGLASLLGRRRR